MRTAFRLTGMGEMMDEYIQFRLAGACGGDEYVARVAVECIIGVSPHTDPALGNLSVVYMTRNCVVVVYGACGDIKEMIRQKRGGYVT